MTPGPGYFEDLAEPDKKLFVSSDTENATDIELFDRHIFVDGSSPQTEIVMPNVSEAEGYEFVVQLLTVPSTTDAGVKVNLDDGIDGTKTDNITTAQTQVVYKSDGIDWHIDDQSA